MTDRRRRQKENREARRQAERKAEGRQELVRRLLFALGMGAVVVLTFVVLSVLTGDSTALPGSYEGYRDQPTACDAEQPPAETVMTFDDYEQQADVTADSRVTANVVTSCGEIVIELDPQNYPETVQSFVFLAREGFHDGTVFHRVLADFVAQGGDPDAVGTGGPGYRIPDEFPPDDFSYERGDVAMANSGRNTTGSQFFFVLGEDARVLNPQFNLLGTVVSGDETLDRIAEVPTAVRPGSPERSLPLETIYIESVEIEVG